MSTWERFRKTVERKETDLIEYKSAMRYNKTKQKVLPELEKKIVNTVVGFMNAEGGILLIGVNNDGKIQRVPKFMYPGQSEHLEPVLIIL